MKNLTLLTSILFLFNITHLIAQEKPTDKQDPIVTYITGKIDDMVKYDTLSLILDGPFYYYGRAKEMDAAQILTTTTDKHGRFKFKILTGKSPYHITLYLSSKRNKMGILSEKACIYNYLTEPGDSINVTINQNAQFYSGKGADLFDAQNKLDNIDKGDKILKRDPNGYFRKNNHKWLIQKDSLLNAKLSLLRTFQSNLSPIAYGIIRADIIGVNRGWIYRRISFAGPFFVPGTPLEKDLNNLCKELERRPAYINPADGISLTPKYIYYLYDKLRIEAKYAKIINNEKFIIDDIYFSAINTQYTGILRDKLLTYWLASMKSSNRLRPEYIKSALSVMKERTFIKMVEKMNSTLSKGLPLTDFEFKDINDKTVLLTDFQGKIILIDLWFTGCSPCAAVAAGLPLVEQAFENRSDVVFVSLSVDKDKKLWLKSIDKNQQGQRNNYFVSSSTKYLYTGGTAGNNPFIKKYVPGGAYPFLLIIDKEGKIFSSSPSHPIDERRRKNLIQEINDALANK